MQLTYQQGREQIALQVEPAGDGWRVRFPGGSEHIILANRLPGDILQITEGDHTYSLAFARTNRGLEISFGGQAYVFTDPAEGKKKGRRLASSGTLVAPMVGVVADVLVQDGERVKAYQPIAVVSAMKVYATVEAPFAGTVRAVYVQKDQRVEHGAALAEIAPDGEAGS